MRNRPRHENEPQDHDSFLDIVANIVGILIILVMVVSVRAKDAPLMAITSSEVPVIDVATPRATATAIAHDVNRLAGEVHQMDGMIAGRYQERNAMATMLAAAETEIEKRRQSMGQQEQLTFDLRNEIDQANRKLEKIDLQRIQVAGAPSEVVLIESLPTPISKSVVSNEEHFQLRGGLLAYIPLNSLIADAKAQAQEKVWKLDNLPESIEMVGPRGGFRLRYSLERVPIPRAVRMETGRSGYLIRSNRWELIPVDSQLGDPIDVALAAGSQLQQVLRGLDPKRTTITVWTYPEDFEAFRKLKHELFRYGFAVAGRPLPAGTAIAGSANGSRSSAQ